jgi:hypothetical protein
MPAHFISHLKEVDPLRALGIEVRPHIPTVGHAGTVLNTYNMIGVESDDPLLASHSITDLETVAGFWSVCFRTNL